MITSSASARESSACSRSFIEANSRISSVPIFAKACMYACPVNFVLYTFFQTLKSSLEHDLLLTCYMLTSFILLYLITSELCFIENHFSSRTHLTYQFLIHVLLHVERNSALSLRPYHIEFDTHLESLLFTSFLSSPRQKMQHLDVPQNNAVRTAKDGVLCKAEYVSKIIVITPIIFFMYYSLKSANTIILKCVSTFSLSRINELIISEEWTKSSLHFIPL